MHLRTHVPDAVGGRKPVAVEITAPRAGVVRIGSTSQRAPRRDRGLLGRNIGYRGSDVVQEEKDASSAVSSLVVDARFIQRQWPSSASANLSRSANRMGLARNA